MHKQKGATTTSNSVKAVDKQSSNHLNNNTEMPKKASVANSNGRPLSASPARGKSTSHQAKPPKTPAKTVRTSSPPPGEISRSPQRSSKNSANQQKSDKPPVSSVTALHGGNQAPQKSQNTDSRLTVNHQGLSNKPPVPSTNNGSTDQQAAASKQSNHLLASMSTSSVKSNGQSQRPKTSIQENPKPPTGINNAQPAPAVSNPANPVTKPITSNTTVFQRQSVKVFPIPIAVRNPSNISRSMVSLERSRNFRAFIEKAMHDHKIFACCGVYPGIRNALKKRGWVEKPGPLVYTRSINMALANNNTKGPEDESDVAWMTRILKDYAPDFIWVIRRDNIDWKFYNKEQLINRFPKAWFTTKVGLAACLQHMHWFSEAGVSDTFFPRCYRLCLEEERQAFQDDFRLTACMSYLRYFVETFESKGHTALADPHSKITPLSVDFASRQLGNYIRMRRHEDIDWLLPPNFMTQHWDAFIHQYYAIVHERKRLRFDNPEAVHAKYEIAKKMLHKMSQYWPQMELDGKFNMWICKPGARSRGKGIVIMNSLEKIMDLLNQGNFRECNWVVQKYIEKPMLIYKTKFDIRQWFLITDWTPLTVWFYKESYIRFCTKPFVLEDFHESIHLCNNAIQCRYQNSDLRDTNLPDENMWSSDTFQAYLKTIGRLDAWPLIYSGMKQAIVGVLLASQETVESRKGCFELYGADFMLTEDFRPWLIEINSCPCMAASTSVTARMCAQCLEDTIKVAVDRRNNRHAGTGLFEMIYRQNAGSVVVQQFSGHDLTVIGKKLTRDIEWPMTMSKTITTTVNTRKSSHTPAVQHSHGGGGNRQTLSELLQKLRVRNQEMFQGKAQALEATLDTVGANTAALLMSKIKEGSFEIDADGNANVKSVTNKAEDKQAAAGKGEDPSSKFQDMNSLAYLMRNSANKDSSPGESKSKRSDDRKSSTVSPQQDSKSTPKTIAEVKALVEDSQRQSQKYGKTWEKIYCTTSLHDFRFGESGESDNGAASTHSTFDTHSGKKSIDALDFNDSSPRSTENQPAIPNRPSLDITTKEEESNETCPDLFEVKSNPLRQIKSTTSMDSGVTCRRESMSPIPRTNSCIHQRLIGSEATQNPTDESKCDNDEDPGVGNEETLESPQKIPILATLESPAEEPLSMGLTSTNTPDKSEVLQSETDLIDLISSDATVHEKMEAARSQTNTSINVNEADDPQGKLYQSILFSSSSSSESDNDNDDNNNDINLASLLITPPYRQDHSVTSGQLVNVVSQKTEPPSRLKSLRFNQRRNTVPTHRRCSKRFPCYRVLLESEYLQRSKSKRRTAPTLPMKTINLLLPPDCQNYF